MTSIASSSISSRSSASGQGIAEDVLVQGLAGAASLRMCGALWSSASSLVFGSAADTIRLDSAKWSRVYPGWPARKAWLALLAWTWWSHQRRRGGRRRAVPCRVADLAGGGVTNQPRYQISRPRRLLNRVVRPLARLGLAGRHTYILSVPRRKSGGMHTTPVSLVENADGRWLVSPYGETGWVRNARVARHVTLSRAGRSETVRVAELAVAEAAPVLRSYVKMYRFVRPFFEVRPDSRLEDFAAEAPRHPVFAIHASTTLSPDIDHDRG